MNNILFLMCKGISKTSIQSKIFICMNCIFFDYIDYKKLFEFLSSKIQRNKKESLGI